MTDPVKTSAVEVQPVAVTVIGTPPVGGPVTVVTPGASQPNIVVTVVSPLVAIVVRFLNVYVGMVVGLLGTAMTSGAIAAPDFYHLVLKCGGLAIGGAVVLSLKDVVTVLSGLEQKFPLATGSV
jgi:hypothetical protein